MIRYTSNSQQHGFRANRPITNEEIALYAPSIMGQEAHGSRSDRYQFIPTLEVLDGLRAEGFEPFEVRQTKVKDLSRKDSTKHLIRLRHANNIAADDVVPEVLLLNSHDGSSSYQLLSGFFRMVCSNGLIAGDICDDVRIRHTGYVVDEVIEGSYKVLDNIEMAKDRIQLYKSVELTQVEQAAFAYGAGQLRFEDKFKADGEEGRGRIAQQLLGVHRWADKGADAWKTLNVVQENVIKGGIRTGRTKRGARVSSRGVTGVDQDVKLNKALWAMMDKLVQVKTGEASVEDYAIN